MKSFGSIQELKKYKERFNVVLRAAKICVFEVDIQNQLYTFFENAEMIFEKSGEKILKEVWGFSQLPPEEYQKKVMDYFAHPEDVHTITRAFENIFAGKPCSYQARMKAGDTKFVWCKIDVVPVIENGEIVNMVGVITDINQMKLERDNYRAKSRLDPLTGLCNRSAAESKITHILKNSKDNVHALLLFDIDNFKRLNDTQGHLAGDEALRRFAGFLMSQFRKTDVIGRWGGDEFILFLRDIGDVENLYNKLDTAAENIKSGLGTTQSVGISVYPDHGRDFKTLFIKADEALYQAKKNKDAYYLYREWPESP